MKIKRGYDQMDNACHKLLEEIAGKDLEWNVEAFAEVRDAVEDALCDVYNIEIEFIDDSLCAQAEGGQIPVVVVTEDESEILRQDEFGQRI